MTLSVKPIILALLTLVPSGYAGLRPAARETQKEAGRRIAGPDKAAGTAAYPGLARTLPSDQSDVRAAVQRIFNQLKNGEYSALYDALPSSARARTSRERLVQGLQRTQDTFELQKIDIGLVSVSGNLAVVDTTMYAHVKPFNADGKLVVQQYLIREDGGWKVATGDTATINRFLQSNPTFAKRFPIKKPQAFVYQNNKWVPLPLGPRR